MLEEIAADEDKQALRGEWRTNRSRRVDREGESDDLDRDWIYVLLGLRMGRRSDLHDVGNRELQLLSGGVVDTGRCRAGIQQRETRNRRREASTLLQNLLRDRPPYADAHLDDGPPHGESRLGRDLDGLAVARSTLAAKLDVKDGHAAGPW